MVQLVGAGGLALGASLLLPPAETGFFFLLLSLLGAQALLDAGSSTVLLSFVARAMRHLRWDADGRLVGTLAARMRLGDLTRLALAWAVGSALLALAVVLPLALLLLDLRPEAAVLDPLRHITAGTLAALALYQLGAAVPLVLEGTGRVTEVARLRAGLDLLAYLAAAACLVSGQGLWAPAVLWAVRGGGNLLWSLYQGHRLLGSPLRRGLRKRLARLMLPMQWRLAVSWTAGFFGQQALVPVCYALLGPAQTGRVALGLFIANGVLMLATAPVAARTPELGLLGAARRWREFDALSRQVLRRCLLTALAFHSMALAGVMLLAALSMPAAVRLPEVAWLALLALSSLAIAATQAIAAALRACGGEPFLAPSVVGAAMLVPSLVVGAQLGGVSGLCLTHLLLSAGLGLPWALSLRRSFELRRA
jgi:hypothetical protein